MELFAQLWKETQILKIHKYFAVFLQRLFLQRRVFLERSLMISALLRLTLEFLSHILEYTAGGDLWIFVGKLRSLPEDLAGILNYTEDRKRNFFFRILITVCSYK